MGGLVAIGWVSSDFADRRALGTEPYDARDINPRNSVGPIRGERSGCRVPAEKTFRWDLARAGIVYQDAGGRWIDFHSLRVTFGTWLAVNGVHPRTAMELMRHSDIKLTMKIYTDAGQLPLAASIAALPMFNVGSSKPSRVLSEKYPLKAANS